MRVEIFNEEFPLGMEFDFGGLLLINGEEVEVDEDQEATFVTRNSKTVAELAVGNKSIKVDGVTLYIEPTPEVEIEVEAQEEELSLLNNPDGPGEGGEY